MDSERAYAGAVLEEAHRMLAANIEGVSIDEALEAAGGYRSILGILKHVACWNAVYSSFAFDPEPRHWNQIDASSASTRSCIQRALIARRRRAVKLPVR